MKEYLLKVWIGMKIVGRIIKEYLRRIWPVEAMYLCCIVYATHLGLGEKGFLFFVFFVAFGVVILFVSVNKKCSIFTTLLQGLFFLLFFVYPLTLLPILSLKALLSGNILSLYFYLLVAILLFLISETLLMHSGYAKKVIFLYYCLMYNIKRWEGQYNRIRALLLAHRSYIQHHAAELFQLIFEDLKETASTTPAESLDEEALENSSQIALWAWITLVAPETFPVSVKTLALAFPSFEQQCNLLYLWREQVKDIASNLKMERLIPPPEWDLHIWKWIYDLKSFEDLTVEPELPPYIKNLLSECGKIGSETHKSPTE